MPKISMLKPWLERREPLRAYIKSPKNSPHHEYGCFLSLDEVFPVYKTATLEAESLSESWKRAHNYVKQALRIIGATRPGWLDNEEVDMILRKLGDPPPLCYPIYLISVAKRGSAERIVYIGKTSSKKSRFSGGHLALTKLHHPKYNGMTKRLYLGAIVLLSEDKDYLPLEWVKPFKDALGILKSIEAQLIYRFKPELNSHHIKNNNAGWIMSIHIQNFARETQFLRDEFCYPEE